MGLSSHRNHLQAHGGSETEPLLAANASHKADVQAAMKPIDSARKSEIWWRPVVLIHLIFVVNGLGYFMSVAPQTQLFEDLVCKAYYDSPRTPQTNSGDHASSKDPCKMPPVQESLAMLFGFQAMFDGLPGLLLAMPYGVAADKLGRKPILLLSMVGQALASAWAVFVCWYALPLRLVWLSSAFTVVGGGSTVAAAVCMMVIADATAEENRSKLFFSLQGSFIAMEILGPPLGAIMMERNLWTPILLGLACSILSACLAMLVPETLTNEKRTTQLDEEDMVASKSKPRALQAVNSWASHCFGTIRFVVRHRHLAYLVLSFLVVDFGRQSLALLLQYVSERYGWPLAKVGLLDSWYKCVTLLTIIQASYLLSFRASAQLLLFLFILPAIDSCLISKRQWPAKVKDLRLARLSIWLLTSSFVAFAFAPNVGVIAFGLTLYTLGTGFNTFARSLVSALVEPAMIGTLYTTLSVMDTTGSLLAGPLVAQAFKWAMQIGGIWHGLPYMLSFALCGLGALLLSRIYVQTEDEQVIEANALLVQGDDDVSP